MRTALPAAAYRKDPEGLMAIWLIWLSPGGMDILLAEEQVSPEPTWPDDLAHRTYKIYESGAIYNFDLANKSCVYSRESAYTFGQIPDVPDFDVSGGNCEDEAGGVPEI